MISAIAHGNAKKAGGYFEEHLSQDEYYAQGEIRPGQWIGNGVAQLGLQESARVERASFMALCENRHPLKDTQLTLRQKSEGKRRIYYDFTCSAPKSLSILAVTLGDNRLISAHEEAAQLAFRELQSFASTRVRKNASQEDRTTGTLVAVRFTHTASRALDPQLHTHFTVFNATYDAAEKSWKALQTGPMYEAIGYATEVYRNHLARSVEAMGYRIERARHGWQIQGVSAEIQRRFSKRSAQRDEVVQAMEARLGRSLTNDEVSRAVHQSRGRKIKGLSTAEIREHQRAQLQPSEQAALGALCSSVVGGAPAVGLRPGDAIDYALAHVFERASVVPERELLKAALAHDYGRADLEQLKSTLQKHPELVRTGQGVSTRAILASEVGLIRTVNAARESVGPLNLAFTPSDQLGNDQKLALLHLLQTPDRITGLRGLAGSGKTTTLKELARACEANGYRLVCCAPTAAATGVLRAEGFEAVTLSAFLVKPDRVLGPRDVVVLDEAGAVGVEAMSKLFAVIPQSRVILCGDSGQHAPVARGDAFRLLEDHSELSCGLLSEIRRQRTAGYRQAVEWAAERKTAAAFTQLQRLDAIQALDRSQIPDAASAAYVAARSEGRSVLLVAPTWEEIGRITESVRSSLKEVGRLGSADHEVRVFDSLSWTQAQRADAGSYRVGLQVRFHRRKGGFASGETVEVVGHGVSVQVRRADGSIAKLPARELADALDVGEARMLKVAVGDKLLLQSNVRKCFTNGEVVEVKEVRGDSILLKDGRTLPDSYRTFTHGYAVTSHASQGKTVDEVIVVASSQSLAAVSQEQFYVSISRARDRCRVLTDDVELLRRHVTRSSVRVSAYEATQGQGRLRGLPPSVRQGIRQWWTQARQRIGKMLHQVERLTRSQRLTQRTRIPPPDQAQTQIQTPTQTQGSSYRP